LVVVGEICMFEHLRSLEVTARQYLSPQHQGY
jgi:hypothetical protein